MAFEIFYSFLIADLDQMQVLIKGRFLVVYILVNINFYILVSINFSN